MKPRTQTEQLRTKYRRTAGRTRGREERLDPQAVETNLQLTYDSDQETRCAAIRSLCPCHVQANRPEVWDRLLALAQDTDLAVRKTVFHTLGDGSPRDRENEVIAVLEALYNDPDVKFRRQVRRLLTHYRKTGTINIL